MNRLAMPAEATAPTSVLAAAHDQFDAAADHLQLDPSLRTILKTPWRELTVHFPVTLDDGRVGHRSRPGPVCQRAKRSRESRDGTARLPR